MMMTISDKVANKFMCSGASISVKNVTKRFGKVIALNDLSLSVDPGTVFALLGPNGSGKTTIVRILTTLLRPDSGSAHVGDYDVVQEAQTVRSVIGLAGQYPAVDENLTGKENLEMIGLLYHLAKRKAKARSSELLELFALSDAANRRVKTYSGGMRRRLDLAATLVANPPVLFLDEPTTGLDPRSRLGLWDVISQQSISCNTVFLTTQYLEEADRLANKIAIMDNGKVLREGSPQELKDCCGGDTHIKIRVTDHTKTIEAVKVLRELSNEKIYSDEETGEMSLPTAGDASILAEIVRQMDVVGITIAELGLKQPTLDDVFLAITGHTTEEERSAQAQNTETIHRGGSGK
jgi:ABC-2 type transport system ATP-binding protein